MTSSSRAHRHESGPVERVRRRLVVYQRTLGSGERDARSMSRLEMVIEALHQVRRSPVLSWPQRCNDLGCPGIQEGPNQADPIIARWHVRQGSRSERRLARAQDHETRVEIEAEHLVHLEPAVVVVVRGELHEREQRIVLVENAVGG